MDHEEHRDKFETHLQDLGADMEALGFDRWALIIRHKDPGERISFEDLVRGCMGLDTQLEPEEESYGHSDPDWWKGGSE